MLVLNVLVSLLTIIPMPGSYLRQLQERDSVLIADQLHYGVELTKVQEGTALSFPDWSEEFCEGVEIIGDWQIDTVKVYRKKNTPSAFDLKAHLTIVSFDEGEYDLPRIYMQRLSPGGEIDTLKFDALRLEVKTMPVDTATFKVHDIKAQIRYPVTFAEVLPYCIGVILLAGVVLLTVWLVKKYRRRKEAVARKEPAHIIALRELDKYRGNKLWTPEKQKLFYSGVTDVLRTYIAGRYGIGAMEMTTAEIFDEMCNTDVPKELQDALRELFERADFVKFAKHVASDEENAGTLPLAVRFVTTTYQAEIEESVQETEVTENIGGSAAEPEETVVEEKDPNEAYMPK